MKVFKMQNKCITFVALFFCTIAIAQTKKADRLFEKWEYYEASLLYKKAILENPSQDLNFKLGVCYQKMFKYKEAQLAYDEVDSVGNYDKADFYFNYGLVLKNNGRYADAKTAFKRYDSLNPEDKRGIFYLNSCDRVIEDHKYDLPFTITNVSSINSINADLSPVLYRDGMVFASTRNAENLHKIYGWTGDNNLHLYYSKKANDNLTFSETLPLFGVKTDDSYHDGPASFSKNFDTIYFARVGRDLKGDDKKTLGIERNKIYLSKIKKGNLGTCTPFFLNNNSFCVSHPFLSSDGSKLYFVSDMPDGYGETDIYVCTRTGKGWSAPKNLGDKINTFGKEKYPTLDSAGTLYFASEGYAAFGGLDICVALNKGGEFQQAIPMKAPFNSSANDIGITFVKEGKAGYFSSNRTGGKGDYDIYYFDMARDSVPGDITSSIYTMGYIYQLAPIQTAIVIKDSIIGPLPSRMRADVEAVITMAILFDLNKFNIRPDAAKCLDSMVIIMREKPEMLVEANAHTDSRASFEYNTKLSDKRAAAIVKYMVSKGIDKKKLIYKGFGETELLNRCADGIECTEEEHQVNRRVEFLFVRAKKPE